MAEVGDKQWSIARELSSHNIGVAATMTVTVSARELLDVVVTEIPTGYKLVPNPERPTGYDWVMTYRYEVDETWSSYEPVSGVPVSASWSLASESGVIGSGVTDANGQAVLPWVVDERIAHTDYTKWTGFQPQFHFVAEPAGEDPVTRTLGPSNSMIVPLGMVPEVTEWGLSEGNPDVPSGLPFIAGMSILKADTTIAGTFGAPLTTQTVTLGSAPIGDGIPLSNPGTLMVRATATDTRGRVLSQNNPDGRTNIVVAAYDTPTVEWAVARVDEFGDPDMTGLFLQVSMISGVSFLGGANAHQVRVSTRPRGGSTWTERNVIDPPGATFADTFLIGGGGIYDRSQGWEVLVEVEDAITLTYDTQIVASGGVILDADRNHTALGAYVDPLGPAVQLGKDTKIYGDLEVTGIIAGIPKVVSDVVTTASNGLVTVDLTDYGFTTAPVVVATSRASTATPPVDVHVYNVTATGFSVRTTAGGSSLGTQAVSWVAIEQ